MWQTKHLLHWHQRLFSPRVGLALLMLFILLAGCASKPKIAPSPPVAVSPSDEMLDYALSLEGTPYRWGKSSPEDGFDCSGFVWHVYRHYGYSIPRTARQIAEELPAVDVEERQPGDLLVFNTGDKPFAHVGLYLGNDSFIHASSGKAESVVVSNLDTPYWWGRFAGVRRPYRLD